MEVKRIFIEKICKDLEKKLWNRQINSISIERNYVTTEGLIMPIGHYGCKNLFPCGVGSKQGFCQKTGKWAFVGDDTTDCPYRENKFKKY